VANETVEEVNFAFGRQGLDPTLECEYGWTGVRDVDGPDKRPKGVDLADMVNQSEPRTRPLYIYFTFGAQAEAMHPLLYTEVGKDRLDDPQPSGIDALADFTIDLHLHLIEQVGLLAVDLDGKIPVRGRGLAQTARA